MNCKFSCFSGTISTKPAQHMPFVQQHARFAYHGKTLAWHKSNFEKNYKAGWVPANVSCVFAGGQTYVTALWEKKSG